MVDDMEGEWWMVCRGVVDMSGGQVYVDGLCCCFIYSGDLGIGVVASSLNSA